MSVISNLLCEGARPGRLARPDRSLSVISSLLCEGVKSFSKRMKPTSLRKRPLLEDLEIRNAPAIIGSQLIELINNPAPPTTISPITSVVLSEFGELPAENVPAPGPSDVAVTAPPSVSPLVPMPTIQPSEQIMAAAGVLPSVTGNQPPTSGNQVTTPPAGQGEEQPPGPGEEQPPGQEQPPTGQVPPGEEECPETEAERIERERKEREERERRERAKVGICHETSSKTNPFVFIRVSINAVPAHIEHGDEHIGVTEEFCANVEAEALANASGASGGDDQGASGASNGASGASNGASGASNGASGASNGASGGASQGNASDNDDDALLDQDENNFNPKVSLCHRTGSETNPFVFIRVSANALRAHLAHSDHIDFDGECERAAEEEANDTCPSAGSASQASTGASGVDVGGSASVNASGNVGSNGSVNASAGASGQGVDVSAGASSASAGASTNVAANGTGDSSASFDVLDDDGDFVQQMYIQSLGRRGHRHEIDFWTTVMHNGGGRDAVVAGIEGSLEANTALVKSWYSAFLDRDAVNGEEQFWVNMLVEGQSEEDVLAGILGSAEFHARCETIMGTEASDETFVRALYKVVLNREATSAEVMGWVNLLPVLDRDGVAEGFLRSQEFRAIAVFAYYEVLLDRRADQEGMNFWVNADMDLDDIRAGFRASDEFFSCHC